MSGRPDGHADAALPEETVVSIEDDGDTEFRPFDEVRDEFQPGPQTRVMGEDGLPFTVDETTHSDIPVLSPATLVCMGDFSAFVTRRDWGEENARYTPEQVQRMPDGRWMLKAQAMEVEPLRPPCRHYVRQKGQMDGNAQHTQLYRLCAARRTTEGAFMSLRDYGLYACDMREPFDLETARQLDAFDDKKVDQGRNRKYHPMLAPAPQPSSEPELGGIFGSNTKE